MTAPYQQVLTAVASVVSGLGLTYQGAAVTVEQRKLPTAEEGLDNLPQLAVCPSAKADSNEPYAFGYRELKITVDVVAMGAGNQAMINGLSDAIVMRNTVSDYFEQNTGQAFATLQAMVNGLQKVDLEYEAVIDRSKLNDNYDYSGMSLTFTIIRASGS